MEIRTATKEDLSRIMELGKEFGHLMLYQKDPMMMEQYLDRILVAEEVTSNSKIPTPTFGTPIKEAYEKEVVGYYHYIVSDDLGFEEMLKCYRQFPDHLILEACNVKFGYGEIRDRQSGELCICMQGASHREVFREFILYLQERYPEIWNYCSIKSRRVDTYKELGFTYNLIDRFTFFNVSKGDISTYQLGRWKK